MYTGDDPLAPNYDPVANVIRAPHTGSDGPRFVLSEEDLSTHREVLSDYPAPFEDLGPLDWMDDGDFATILAAMNARTARGDVPVNLNATTLVYARVPLQRRAPASGPGAAVLGAWRERAERNGGVLPDNVGLSGEGRRVLGRRQVVGRALRLVVAYGMLTVVEPVLNASLNAYLLTGDEDALALARSQLDVLYDLGETRDGLHHIPHKHLDGGWTDRRPASPAHAIQLWSQTLADEDRQRVERTPARPEERVVRVPQEPFAVKHHNLNSVPWYRFVVGDYPDFPADALRANLQLLALQLDRMRSDEGDPRNWDHVGRIAGRTDGPSLRTDGYAIHAWQEFSPIVIESLLQLVWGAPAHISHGGLQFATFRYFDTMAGRPGLPDGVSALARDLTAEGATLELVNTGDTSRQVGIQGGAFREHILRSVEVDGHVTPVGETDIAVELPPLSALSMRIGLQRHASTPTYETMVSPEGGLAPTHRAPKGQSVGPGALATDSSSRSSDPSMCRSMRSRARSASPAVTASAMLRCSMTDRPSRPEYASAKMPPSTPRRCSGRRGTRAANAYAHAPARASPARGGCVPSMRSWRGSACRGRRTRPAPRCQRPRAPRRGSSRRSAPATPPDPPW